MMSCYNFGHRLLVYFLIFCIYYILENPLAVPETCYSLPLPQTPTEDKPFLVTVFHQQMILDA